jgi:hypothetical protein
MSVTTRYNHILYNIGNESGLDVEWDNFWASYIQDAAREHGRNIHVTSMKFAPDTSVRQAMTHRNIYTFADVSQNNQDALGPVGKKHWENLLFWKRQLTKNQLGVNLILIFKRFN